MKFPPRQEFVTGYRPVVRAREGRMFGIRHPLDGPIFQTAQDAEYWCVAVMISHYDRGLGMSDASIERFQGMVSSYDPPSSGLLRDVERICKAVKKKSNV